MTDYQYLRNLNYVRSCMHGTPARLDAQNQIYCCSSREPHTGLSAFHRYGRNAVSYSTISSNEFLLSRHRWYLLLYQPLPLWCLYLPSHNHKWCFGSSSLQFCSWFLFKENCWSALFEKCSLHYIFRTLYPENYAKTWICKWSLWNAVTRKLISSFPS